MEHLNDDQGLDAFALAVYGLIIFPRVIGYVEVAAVDFFEQIQNRCNPSPVILAETFRSLNFYRQNTESRFVGCLPMLYIWLRSHLPCKKSVFMKPYLSNSLPIEEFCNSEWPGPRIKEHWVAFLGKISNEQLIWLALWMPPVPILYRCGDELWVPLPGHGGNKLYASFGIKTASSKIVRTGDLWFESAGFLIWRIGGDEEG